MSRVLRRLPMHSSCEGHGFRLPVTDERFAGLNQKGKASLAIGLSTISPFCKCGSLWNLIWRQTSSRFKSTCEVEKGDQRGDFPDCLLVPAGAPELPRLPAVYHTRSFGQLAGVAEQRPGLLIHLVLGPGCGELIAQMFIARQAANCRRVQAQSRRAAHLAIHHRRQHFSLEPAER